MAPGRKNLRRIQFGKEVTPGTAVVATTRWRGTGAIADKLVVKEIDEDIGILGDTDRSVIPQLMGQLDLKDIACSFEQLQYLFAMGMGGPVTGVADGSGSDKIYTNNIPTTALPTTTSYTIEGGDDFEVERMEYTVATKIQIHGNAGEELQVNASLMGRQVQRFASGFTAASIPATIEDILVSKGKFYIDAIGGTYGTTQVVGQILGIDVTFEWTWVPKFTMDGQLYYTFPAYTGQKVSGKITFEHDAAASGNAGAKADWRSNTPKKIQTTFGGSALSLAGTTYSVKTLIIALPSKWKVISELQDKTGNDIVTAEFFSKYDLTAGDAGKVIVVNEQAALA